jgi:hypothetical protein
VAAIACALAAVAPAAARFPYPARLAPGATPDELGGSLVWKFAATPEPRDGLNGAILGDPGEDHGVRGASIVDASPAAATAWMRTTGRPDVTLAVLDSGVKWNDASAMADLRRKLRLDVGELPAPRADRPTALGSGRPCAGWSGRGDDRDRDGVVTVDDWACDRRVTVSDPRRAGPSGVLTPQDLLIAFSDGRDDDADGFVDDIAGWDFLDDDNDPYDDVQYGHGTGEARDSTAEADNGGDLGTCPNCTWMPVRVGDSFVADANRFAAATAYAVDRGASVVQEALGTLNQTRFARQAIDYAYGHGVPVIASAADEAAQHHNEPSSLPHLIVVNSVRRYDETLTPRPRSYLQVNGCTNFSSQLTLSVPSTSCSSEATGRAAGIAGLVVSAALTARREGRLASHPTCRRASGARCAISAEEVRQVLVAGADDVSFTGGVEPSCATRARGCTDPTGALQAVVDAHRPVSGPIPSRSYPARHGHDQFTGYGRIDARRAIDGLSALPPEVAISSPDWFTPVDPRRATRAIGASVFARGRPYTCRVLVAPGSYPNDARAPRGDFALVRSPWCDGRTRRRAFAGTVARLDLAALGRRFPPDAGRFDGPTPPAGSQRSGGRPNSEPYGFVVKIVARAAGRVGQDRRNLYLHRDRELLPGFPHRRAGGGDLESSPLLADLDGRGGNDLVYATADGLVHALTGTGRERRGFPVGTPRFPALHPRERAFRRGAVSPGVSSAVLSAVGAADLDGDGRLEVLAADFDGHVTAWDARGRRVFARATLARLSGRPLRPFVNVRHGPTNRTQRGFLSAPVVADLDGRGRPEIVAAAMDRHVYAWHANGRPVGGFPRLVVDRTKVARVDPRTDAVTFRDGVGATLNQGAIVHTPAVGDLTGDGRPEIVVGTNEEYAAGADGGANAAGLDGGILGTLAGAGALNLANGRLYALRSDGTTLPGWPFRVARINAELLPVVGEGVTGSPVLGRVRCPSGGPGTKVGVVPDAGPGFVLNRDGTSCQGSAAGRPRPLEGGGGVTLRDLLPTFPALGQPAFARLGGSTAFLAPTSALLRSVDVAVPEYQGGRDSLSAWNAATGRLRRGFPAAVDDLQFLTGPIAADVDGRPGDEVLGGSSSLDLSAFTAAGRVVPGFPKLTTGWMVADPTVGEWGGRRVLVGSTRSGLLFAWRVRGRPCAAGSWPRFHHDIANSGDAARDAVPPGAPRAARRRGRRVVVVAPGDDGACGRAARYRLTVGGRRVAPRIRPGRAGALQRLLLPRGARGGVRLRAVDEQGNAGPAAAVR